MAAGTWLNHVQCREASQLPNAGREHFDQPLLTPELMQASESALVICVPDLYLWPEAGDDVKHLLLDS